VRTKGGYSQIGSPPRSAGQQQIPRINLPVLAKTKAAAGENGEEEIDDTVADEALRTFDKTLTLQFLVDQVSQLSAPTTQSQTALSGRPILGLDQSVDPLTLLGVSQEGNREYRTILRYRKFIKPRVFRARDAKNLETAALWQESPKPAELFQRTGCVEFGMNPKARDRWTFVHAVSAVIHFHHIYWPPRRVHIAVCPPQRKTGKNGSKRKEWSLISLIRLSKGCLLFAARRSMVTNNAII